MNLKQALKQKNRLVGLINEEYKKASQYNSIEKVILDLIPLRKLLIIGETLQNS